MNEIMPMRTETQKNAGAVKAAIEKKAPREQICTLVKRFAASEAKFVKYLEDNATWCQIPPQAVDELKKNHGNTLGFQKKACEVAMAPQQPRGPGLSEALGTTRIPTQNNVKTGGGAFDTLTGNVLAR